MDANIECKEFGSFTNNTTCFMCASRCKCISETEINFLPNAYMYGGAAGLIAFVTMLSLLHKILELAWWVPAPLISIFSVFIVWILYKHNKTRYIELFKNICTNGKSCKDIRFNISLELKHELREFNNMLLGRHGEILSRTEYIDNAKEFRDREISSIHVMYLTKNSLDVYSHEIKDWVDSEKQDDTRRNRRRLVVVNPDVRSEGEKIISLLRKLEKSSEIKIINDKVLWGDLSYKKLLKDFGVFVVKQKDIISKYGFFTVANVTKLDHAKHIFSMLTDEFYIVQDNEQIDQYLSLFDLAWNDNNLMFFNVSSFVANYGMPINSITPVVSDLPPPITQKTPPDRSGCSADT